MQNPLSLESEVTQIVRYYGSGRPDSDAELRSVLYETLVNERDGLGKTWYTRRLRDRAKNFVKRRRYTTSHFLSLEEMCDMGFQFSSSGDVIPPGRFKNDG